MSRHRKEKSRSVRIVGAVYDRPRCSSCKIVGGHRPPLQFGCFALSVTCWAHHDFTDQAVLPGEIRTSEVCYCSRQRSGISPHEIIASWTRNSKVSTTGSGYGLEKAGPN